MYTVETFSIQEIADWQLITNSKVELPNMQRGFVWKPSQIELVWDSLLRGYPIGSFLMSPSEDQKHLLDGQQRATSIALGLYNPWDSSKDKFWSNKSMPVLWISLKQNHEVKNRKYIVKALTRSHPWGYQDGENQKILSLKDRKSALSKLERKEHPDYTKIPPETRRPFGSGAYVPLSILIDSIWYSDGTDLLNQCASIVSPEELKLIQVEIQKPFFDELKHNIHSLNKVKVPSLLLSNSILIEEDENISSENESEQSKEDSTLFVRLNSGGTRLEGEELIYSIFKAHFPDFKKMVDEIKNPYMSGARVVSLLVRLARSTYKVEGVTHVSKVALKDFQKWIRDGEFVKHLTSDLESGVESIKRATKILEWKDDGFDKIPPVLLRELIAKNQDSFYLIALWLIHNKNNLNYSEKDIIATFTYLCFFSKKQDAAVKQLIDDLDNAFWKVALKSRKIEAYRNGFIYSLPRPSDILIFFKNAAINDKKERKDFWLNHNPTNDYISKWLRSNFPGKEEDLSNDSVNGIWDLFMNKLFWNRNLLLFAQRKYLNEAFSEYNQQDSLEDTSRPWDWDHIYPSSWVHRRRGVDLRTRWWNNTIGNLRALDLETNRSENDHQSPYERLCSKNDENIRNKSFVQDEDWQYWQALKEPFKKSDSAAIKNHLEAVITRLCLIYKEWYEQMGMEELNVKDV